ncbi:MAG: TetR/AcrR family transcriptional regulator [Pseudobutyrivibrio sp.]|nr:TetR/AcrR family transcriptional regulator [Pseudobutyrivibrio sp.]
MYKTSDDRRFKKNKKIIHRAFIDLVIEKGYDKLTISEIAERADINRMTFYSHYDTIEDIFHEFVDDMEAEIVDAISKEEVFDIDNLFELLNSLMFKELAFFKHVARDSRLELFRRGCKETISQLIRVDLKQGINEPETTRLIIADLTATCIAYSYFDWLAGDYGEISLSTVTEITKKMLASQLESIHYKK